MPCMFPFKLGRFEFTKCTRYGSADGLPWCSTNVTSTRQHIRTYWGHCNQTKCSQVITKENPLSKIISTAGSPTHLPSVPTECEFGNVRRYRRNALKQFQQEIFPSNYDKRKRPGSGGRRRYHSHTSAVYGGKNASFDGFRFAVLIGFKTNNNGIIYACGGSLINQWYVLSAAHCFAFDKAVEVRVGEYNMNDDPDCLDNICTPKVQTVSKL